MILDEKVKQLGVQLKPQKRTVKGLRPSTLTQTRSSLMRERLKQQRRQLRPKHYENLLSREFIESQSN